jgi:hypothetical protein
MRSELLSLKSIWIPAFANAISGFAFARTGIQEIRVSPESGASQSAFPGFTEVPFDLDGQLLVQYFGCGVNIRISDRLEVICSRPFCGEHILSLSVGPVDLYSVALILTLIHSVIRHFLGREFVRFVPNHSGL